MDGNDNEEESYIDHLRSMFDDLDSAKKGGLNRKELKFLTNKLSLVRSQSELLLQLSFTNDEEDAVDRDDSKECVDFNRFQDSFVAVLSATADMGTSHSESEEEIPDQEEHREQKAEVKPRVVRGGKTYGRRSLPDCATSAINLNKATFFDDSRTELPDDLSDQEDVFQNEFYDLPERGAGDGDGVYFEASGQLRNPILDRLRPKSTSTTLNESQLNVSSTTSLMLQTHHLFTELDKNELGFIDISDLTEMWKSEGVNDPEHVLRLLDVSIDADKQINAYDLTSSLENEANTLRLSTVDSVTRAVLATYKHQLAHVNTQVEQQQALLGKMKEDLEKSEIRNSKLIDEVDDRYFHVDKSKEKILNEAESNWSRKLRQTKRDFNKDRELIQTQAMLERDALQQEIERLMIREGSLRSTIDALQMDNDALEQEMKEIVQKLKTSEISAARLQKDLEQLIKEKANSSFDSFNPSQEERFAAIVKDYEAQCSALSDRNDELVAELEKARMEFLHSMRKISTTEENTENNSSSRKRARRRASVEYINEPERDNADHSDTDGDELRVELCGKISEMENTIKKMEEERIVLSMRFTEEKSILRGQLETEFRDKLENERKKMVSFEEMTKSEKNTATNQAIADGRKQRDELEKRIAELKKALEAEQLNSQQSITNLCREFESDKAEVQNKNQELLEKKIAELKKALEAEQLNSQESITNLCREFKSEKDEAHIKNHELVQELEDEMSDLQQQLEKEVEAHETTSQRLKTERTQHKAAMQAHSETMTKLEKSAKQNVLSVEQEEVKRLVGRVRQLEEEIANLERDSSKMAADHEVALDLVKAEMQQKMEEAVGQKRQEERDSVCNELERMQENVVDERKRMQQRINDLKQAFDAEAEELRTLVELEKCELRKALEEESANLRKRLAEEHENAVEKKRQESDDEEREQREAQTRHFEEIIKNLQDAKIDLEEELRHATEEKEELQKQISSLKSEKETNSKSEQLMLTIEQNEKMNAVLQSQITELRMKHLEATQELARAKTQCDAKAAELAQMVKEKQEYADKVISLESEKSTFQVQNARLLSRNIELGKSDAEISAELHEKKVEELQARLEEQEEMCEKLKEKLKTRQSVEKSNTVNKKLSQTDFKTKYEHTRQQLIQQMNKTKELYSKLARGEALIKDLYCENAELMRALQLTEDRYKSSERRVTLESDKNVTLTALLRKICPEAV